MGGLAGHMMHPHDNLNLTFEDLNDLAINCLTGLQPMYEKFDGFNIHFFKLNGEIRFARSGKDLLTGGFGIDDLETRFPNAKVRAIFDWGCREIIQKYKDVLKLDFNTFPCTFNTEIVVKKTNVMPYKDSFIKTHNIFIWECENGKYSVRDVVNNPNGSPVRFRACTGVQAEAIVDMAGFMKENRINNPKITIEKYYFDKFLETMYCKWPALCEYPGFLSRDLFNRFFKNDRSRNLREIRSMCVKDAKVLNDVLAHQKEIVYEIRKSLDLLVLKIGTAILDRCAGINAQAGLNYAAAAVLERAIDQKISDPDFLAPEFYARWNACDRKIFGIEGVVTEFKGVTYKWTGPFAPINQLIGGRD